MNIESVKRMIEESKSTLEELAELLGSQELDEELDEENEYIPLKDHKYLIVSKIAYLIGVGSERFADEESIHKKRDI